MQKVSMHEWIEVASEACCNLRYDFRGAEQFVVPA